MRYINQILGVTFKYPVYSFTIICIFLITASYSNMFIFTHADLFLIDCVGV